MKKIVMICLSITILTTLFIINIREKNNPKILYTFYEDNQKVNEILSDGYVFDRSDCNNGVKLKWHEGLKQAEIIGSITSKTKCNLYFIKNPSKQYFENLQKDRPTELAYDGTKDNNLRFIGSDPYNYVEFNNETWRIIGVMNNIEDSEGNVGSHLKIIKASIGQIGWDSSQGTVNDYNGVNEWSTSAVAKVLNENFYKKEAGGTCYNGNNYTSGINCPNWESIGLNDEARAMVSKVKWNTGTVPVNYTENRDLISPRYMYEMERSENTGKECSNLDKKCNDLIERKTNWLGYVGLSYPSDYSYATNGGSEEQRQTCLTTSINYWSSEPNKTNCVLNSWLYGWINIESVNLWTMTPAPHSVNAYSVFSMRYNGIIISDVTYKANKVLPVVYLNTNIKIEEDNSENYGSKDNPFRLIN